MGPDDTGFPGGSQALRFDRDPSGHGTVKHGDQEVQIPCGRGRDQALVEIVNRLVLEFLEDAGP